LIHEDFLSDLVVSHSHVMSCRRCGKTGIEFTTKQVHAADEGSTTFCACPHCGSRWKMN
jgi:DNA-directed RNA polymerase subunit M/transcription elongation factor TFIIS